MDIGEKFPHIWALAHGTISGRFSEWPKLAPEARAILALVQELQKELAEKPSGWLGSSGHGRI